jgi:hypothetical protein
VFATAPRTWICLLGCAACAAAPPFAPPPLDIVVHYQLAPGGNGAAAAAPGEAVDNDPQPACKSVQLEVFALPTTPAIGSIEPYLAAVAAESGAPFRAASSLPPTTRWVSPAIDLADGQRIGGATAVTAPGLVTTFSLSAPDLPVLGCEATAVGVRLFLLTPPTRERADLLQPLTEAGSGLVFVHARGGQLAGHALVVTITGAAPAEAAAARLQAEAAARPPAVPAAAAQQLRIAAAAIGAQSRRAAMLAVAAQLELPQCTDVLLAADEARLIDIGGELAGLDAGAADYGWTFQRALWTALVPGMQRDELPPGLRATVIRRLGAVAAEPALVPMHLQASAAAAAFAAGLQQENTYALGDRDPVHRVQAHDWLLAHEQAIADYDPLATAAARTAALRAHARAEATRARAEAVR